MTWRNSLGSFEACSCRERSSQSNMRVPIAKDPMGDGSARAVRDWHGAQTFKHAITAIRRRVRKIPFTMRLDDNFPVALSDWLPICPESTWIILWLSGLGLDNGSCRSVFIHHRVTETHRNSESMPCVSLCL